MMTDGKNDCDCAICRTNNFIDLFAAENPDIPDGEVVMALVELVGFAAGACGCKPDETKAIFAGNYLLGAMETLSRMNNRENEGATVH